jgi:hypothetical protein
VVAIACSFVCHSAAQRRNLLFAFCFCRCRSSPLLLPLLLRALSNLKSKNTRHLDRSNRQSHRLLRSGETLAFRFCRCLFFCLSFRSAAKESAFARFTSHARQSEDLLLFSTQAVK